MEKLLIDSSALCDVFQASSPFRTDAIAFLEKLQTTGITATMPAHAWFEVWCTLLRFSSIDKKFAGPIIAGSRTLPIKLIHIDDHFMCKYANQHLPPLKGGDHIFVAVAKVDGYTLITRDNQMRAACDSLGIKSMSPGEYLRLSQPT
ncbi:MAG: hypothetical protein U0172_11505 [Nitrospiraceae bacterium]